MSRRQSPANHPDGNDCLLATHPSDHNAVYAEAVGREGREKRLIEARMKKERDTKVKQWGLDENRSDGGSEQDVAFLVPVPIYYGHRATEGAEASCVNVSDSFYHHLFVFSYRPFQ